jgi:hypothetical protein
MSSETSKDILEARKKFAEMYGNTKLGGKGTETRKKVPKHRAGAVQDKKITSLAKKSRN